MTRTFAPRFHRDNTVTLWDVYTQQWTRTSSPSAAQLAALSDRVRTRVIRHCLA